MTWIQTRCLCLWNLYLTRLYELHNFLRRRADHIAAIRSKRSFLVMLRGSQLIFLQLLDLKELLLISSPEGLSGDGSGFFRMRELPAIRDCYYALTVQAGERLLLRWINHRKRRWAELSVRFESTERRAGLLASSEH